MAQGAVGEGKECGAQWAPSVRTWRRPHAWGLQLVLGSKVWERAKLGADIMY